MTNRHLRIFLTVCECNNNITKAAQQLFMTQPSVTVAIQELEKYYGTVFFDRISRRLYLTEAGKEFREYALRVTVLYEDMEMKFRAWDQKGTLRIGASITVGSQFMPSYVEAFLARSPGADIRVTIAPSNQLEDKIRRNELDAAFIESPVHRQNIVARAYMEDSLAIITPAKAPYLNGGTMTRQEFRKQRFLLREHGSGTRELFEIVLRKADLSVEPVWEGMSTTALVNAVIKGLGISAVPRRMAANPLSTGTVYEMLVEGLEFRRQFYVVYHEDKRITGLLEAFIGLCENYELDYPYPEYYGLT